MAVKLMNFKELKADFASFCAELGCEPEEAAVSLYLEDRGFDITHLDDISKILLENANPIVSDIKIRKTHQTRDKIIKKRVMPLVTSLGVGALFGFAALASSFVIGSTYLGTTLIGIPVTDFINVASIPFIVGTAGCFGFIKLKNYATIKHYERKYGSANKNLQDLENGIDLENLEICKLMDKVEADKAKVLSRANGNWFTKIIKFPFKHSVNAINRNRIHHIEAVTLDLMDKLNTILNSEITEEEKTTKSTNIVKLLERVNEFISNDIETSKVYTLTNCNEAKRHSHKIENLDIYANIQTVLNYYYAETETPRATNKKAVKTLLANTKQKITNANNLFNPSADFKNLIQATLERARTTAPVVEIPAEEAIAPIITEEDVVAPVVTDEVIAPETAEEEIATETAEEEIVPVAIEEIEVEETPVVTEVTEATSATPVRESLIKKMVKVKLDNLASGKKVTITHPDKKNAIIKVTHTPAGRKIKIETINTDGVKASTSQATDADTDLTEQINSILQETALRFGTDLDELKLL